MEIDRYATVLVAVLRTPRDLRLVLEEGWYRIPARRLPPRAGAARHIAFYQPASFGLGEGAVRYVAPIRAWEMLCRRELLPEEPDHPRAAELYYRVRLGEVQPLDPPIPAGRWRRFAFILTHGERLRQARELRDLVHGSLWEEKLWGALRKMGVLE